MTQFFMVVEKQKFTRKFKQAYSYVENSAIFCFPGNLTMIRFYPHKTDNSDNSGSLARSYHSGNARDRCMKMLNVLFQGDSEIVPVTPCHTRKRGRGVVENANIPHITVGAFSSEFR